MIGLGFVLCKTGVFTKEYNTVIARLVILVGSPCLIFDAIVQQDMTKDTVTATFQMLAATVLFFAAGTVLAHLLAGVSGIKRNRDAGVYMALMATINASFMGFPLMQAAFGDRGLYFMAVGNIVFNCFLYSYGIVLINYGFESSGSLREKILPIINPCIIASVAGFVFLCIHKELPRIIMTPLEQIGDITIPLAMISLGISMCGSDFRTIVHNRDLMLTCAFKNFVWPAATFAAVIWIPMDPLVKSVVILMSALPPAISTGVLVTKLGRNSQVASQGTVMMMLVCILTIPVMFLLITHLLGT